MVEKKILDKPCPGQLNPNDAQLCLETKYPITRIWNFEYTKESNFKTLRYKDIDEKQEKVSETEPGKFYGKNI